VTPACTERGRGGQPGEPASYEGEGDVVGQRFAGDGLDVGVVEIVSERADRLDVLIVAVGT